MVLGFGKNKPKKTAIVVQEPEAPLIEPAKPIMPAKAYRIVAGEMLESGLIQYIILSNVSLGAIGEEFKVEE
jgi:hypothetical protein